MGLFEFGWNVWGFDVLINVELGGVRLIKVKLCFVLSSGVWFVKISRLQLQLARVSIVCENS